MCFESVSKPEMRVCIAASLNRGGFRFSPMFERSDNVPSMTECSPMSPARALSNTINCISLSTQRSRRPFKAPCQRKRDVVRTLAQATSFPHAYSFFGFPTLRYPFRFHVYYFLSLPRHSFRSQLINFSTYIRFPTFSIPSILLCTRIRAPIVPTPSY